MLPSNSVFTERGADVRNNRCGEILEGLKRIGEKSEDTKVKKINEEVEKIGPYVEVKAWGEMIGGARGGGRAEIRIGKQDVKYIYDDGEEEESSNISIYLTKWECTVFDIDDRIFSYYFKDLFRSGRGFAYKGGQVLGEVLVNKEDDGKISFESRGERFTLYIKEKDLKRMFTRLKIRI